MSKLPVYHIPVPAHVREFLTKEIGPDPWPIHQNQFMGAVVKMKVERQPFRQLARPTTTPEPDLRKCVRLTLPTALKHYMLTAESSKAIGEMLNKYFQQQMFQFIQGYTAGRQNDRAGLRAFFNLYEINPNDYDLEVARKAYRDYKDRIIASGGHLVRLYQEPESLLIDYAKAS